MGVAQDLFDAVESHALSSALFDRVNTSEPKSTPGSGLSCGVWIQTIGPAANGSGLAATTGRVEFSVRLYSDMLAEPIDLIDPDLTAASITLMESYSGDFGLSVISTVPTVRSIDLLGTYGTPLQGIAGYINIDNQLYRVVTVTLPVIVNDLWTQTE